MKSNGLTDTRGQFLRRPSAVGLAEAFVPADQLVAFGTVISDAAAERVTLAGVPSVRDVRRGAAGPCCNQQTAINSFAATV